MATIGDRIKALRGTMKLKDFAAEIGISAQALINYEKHDRVPRSDVLNSISTKFNVSQEWILTGVGPMNPERKTCDTSQVFDVKTVNGKRNLRDKSSQHIEFTDTYIAEIVNALTVSANASSLQQELLNALRDNASLLRQNGDLRVEVERQKARIAELERQITEGAREAGDEALARLELENRQLREENRVLKRGSIVLAPETDMAQGPPPD